MMLGQEHVQELGEHAAEAAEKFNAGKTIIEHVSNSSIDHPLFHLPTIARDRLLGDQARADAVAGLGVRVRGDHRRRCAATSGRSARFRPAS